MADSIPHTRPFFDHLEANAVREVIESGLVNEGALTAELTNTASRLTNSAGGVPVSTGTLGLHLALKTLGISDRRHEVIIPDFACRCLYDCVKMAGGKPVFCDINLHDYSLSIESVKSRLSTGTRAIILPHMFGCPASVDDFLMLDVPIIEDCTHSLGATYKRRTIGSMGCLSVVSFEGSKLIAAGEGGCVMANSDNSLDHLKALRFGLDGHFSYQYRLSNLVAAVALVQLDKLFSMIKKRQQIANKYYTRLRKLEEQGVMKLPVKFDDRETTQYRFVAICEESSENLIAFANAKGVLLRNPLPSGILSSTYRTYSAVNPNSKLLAERGVSLPIYPELTDDDVSIISDCIYTFFKKVKKYA